MTSMKHLINITLTLTIILATAVFIAAPAAAAKPRAIWVTAYYPGWEQQVLKAEDIDLRPITHLVYFALVPTDTGGVKEDNGIDDATAARLVGMVHKAGKKVLICIGGAGTDKSFQKAIANEYRARFVSNLVEWTSSRGFDGVDVDMEPIEDSDASNFQNFVRELKAGLRAKNPHALMTAACGPAHVFAPVAGSFDQLNLMTYDMSGPWEGWPTW